MLDGWYCRSIANMQAEEQARSDIQRNNDEEYSSDSSHSEPEPNYKAQYHLLKKKLKYLIYENECFQDALRISQKKLLKVSRDRSFLLDRLLQYEKPDNSTTESDETESSDDGDYGRLEQPKRKRQDTSGHQTIATPPSANKTHSTVKRKRAVAPKNKNPQNNQQQHAIQQTKTTASMVIGLPAVGDGHMTPEEVERHLQSRQSYLELLPERAPPTVPTEMFSNDPSLDSESNDIVENSPNVCDDWIE